jgi:phospholipase C
MEGQRPMTSSSRRTFLQAAGSAAFAAALPASIQRAMALPGNHRSGTIKDVEHIVILTQENRSFDHFLGTLRGVRGFSDPRAVMLPNGNSVFEQPDPNPSNPEGFLRPFHPGMVRGVNAGLQFLNDVPHGWTDGQGAFNDGRYDQWVKFKGTNALTYLTRSDLPFHHALADAFTICDAYHCSLNGPTDPNRYHMWTGWTGNGGKGIAPAGRSTAPDGPVVDNSEEGYSWSTYPEKLEKAGISWKVYQDVGEGLDAAHYWGWTGNAYIGNYGDNSLLYFYQYQNAAAGSPLFKGALQGTRISADGTLPDINAAKGLFTQLAADVRANRLPQVSWIAAPEAFSEHPIWPGDFGAWYISQVLDVLTSNEELWSKTVLLVNYDENGGFFDHVVPPYPPQDRSHGLSTVDASLEIFPGQKKPDGTVKYRPGPYGLGARVPMFVVSPWSKGGFVCSEVFDHTSTIRFIEQRFGPTEPNITQWRRTVCGDLTSAFDFRKPESGRVALPSTASFFPPDSLAHSDPDPVPPHPQHVAVQEPGQRPARALPYELEAAGQVDIQRKAVSIAFVNTGRAGAAFQVRSGNPDDLARTYTVEPGKSVADRWTLASPYAYDLWVSGPNGFMRQFKGDAVGSAANLDLAVSYDGEGEGQGQGQGQGQGALRLTLANRGGAPRTVTVASNYRDRKNIVRKLAPGQAAELHFDLEESFGWYDLSITVDSDQGFLRRLAGHVETGEDSLSDPAIGAVA